MTSRCLLINTRKIGENDYSLFLKETEIRSLLETIDIFVASALTFTIKEENSAFFLGKGQLEEAIIASHSFEIDKIVFNTSLKPRMESNLEKAFEIPVIDREAVIISIFFQNAFSLEAKLQSQKAKAMYLKSRLKNNTFNYSQQRGGVRGTKGEGEKKIELDRRHLDEKINALTREIEKIKNTRDLREKRRKKNGIFTFSLVGYTNSGKSTILNSLTHSSVLAEDKLFATLDTTTRSVVFPSLNKVLLKDTVGFISDLPHSLIDAFSSTLNESLSSEAIIIVADISHPNSRGAFEVTKKTLEDLGAWDKVKLLVINKIDSIYDDISFSYLKSQNIEKVYTSFLNGIGRQELLEKMEKIAFK